MSLSEETEIPEVISAGEESIKLSVSPIQKEIVQKAVVKKRPEFKGTKGKKWEKIFDFDKEGMTKGEMSAEISKRKKAQLVEDRKKKKKLVKGDKSLYK